MTDTYNVAIMGATGAVGQVLLEILAERDFPVGELRLLASARSAGRAISFNGGSIQVQELGEDSFRRRGYRFGLSRGQFEQAV